VIFRFDDPEGGWLLAVAASLSKQLAKLEMPAEVRECLCRIMNHLDQAPERGDPWNPAFNSLPDAKKVVRDWLEKTA